MSLCSVSVSDSELSDLPWMVALLLMESQEPEYMMLPRDRTLSTSSVSESSRLGWKLMSCVQVRVESMNRSSY